MLIIIIVLIIQAILICSLYLLFNVTLQHKFMVKKLTHTTKKVKDSKMQEAKSLIKKETNVSSKKNIFKFKKKLIQSSLNLSKKQRVKKLSTQLLEVVTLLSSSLRSGYSLMQALNVVTKESAPPASTEFNQVLQDISIGKSYEEAFNGLIERNPIEHIEIIATAILISRETGGNLGEVLDTVAQTIVEKDKIIGEVKSLTAQGRVSGIIIEIIPIAVATFMFIINPMYIKSFINNPVGRVMLIGAVCSQIIGGLIIKKIIKIDW